MRTVSIFICVPTLIASISVHHTTGLVVVLVSIELPCCKRIHERAADIPLFSACVLGRTDGIHRARTPLLPIRRKSSAIKVIFIPSSHIGYL
jgi:hypothetical protein